jgi:membrane protease YdiL (CAAX protease family)
MDPGLLYIQLNTEIPTPLSSPHNPISEPASPPIPETSLDVPQQLPVMPPRVEDPPWTGWDVVLLSVLSLVAIGFGVIGTAILLRARSPLVIVVGQVLGYVMVLLLMYMVLQSRSSGRAAQALRWNWPDQWSHYLLAGIGLHLCLVPFELVIPMPKHLPLDEFFKTAQDAYLLAGFGIFIAPLFEEIFFRGFLYPVLARRFGMWPSVLLTSFAFVAIHTPQLRFSWGPVLIIFLVGMTLTIVRAKKRSVACTVLMHMAYNATIFVFAFVATDGFRHMEKFNP